MPLSAQPAADAAAPAQDPVRTATPAEQPESDAPILATGEPATEAPAAASTDRFDGEPVSKRVDWLRITPFLALQVGCLLVFVAGWSPVALALCLGLYVVRMFAITAFYHRYFSHRAFRTSRVMQFLFALLGASSVQRSALWWAAHHRKHHRTSDTAADLHSPLAHGFLWSHMFWFTTKQAYRTDHEAVADFSRFPELRFLDKHDRLVPVFLGAALFGLGALLEAVAPSLGTSGFQIFVWGFCISTTLLAHATFTINSLAHVWGSRRYETTDGSRNNPFLALLTLGEGWHNNHHRYPHSVRQGFFRWELDLSYRALQVLERLGLVWELRPVPAAVLAEGRRT